MDIRIKKIITIALVAFLAVLTFQTRAANNIQPALDPIPPVTAHVLVYHNVRPITKTMSRETKLYTVSPEVFENELLYLKDAGYHIVSLNDLSSSAEGKLTLPSKTVVITFDDGWENQYTYAFPLLKKYNATATFFIYTNTPGHSNYMTWDQIRELNAAGMTIGSHSKSHPYLTLITNLSELEKEIFGSKEKIETELGKEIYSFSYPFGLYNRSLGLQVKEAGYKHGRLFGGGMYRQGDSLFAIKSVFVNGNLANFKKQITY